MPASDQIEYRCLWFERIAGLHVPFSGKVTRNFSDVETEKEMRQGMYKIFGVSIEARPASNGPWPRWWDKEGIPQEFKFEGR